MFPLGHIGITLGIAYVIMCILGRSWKPRSFLIIVGVASLIPDLVDKPIGLLYGYAGGGRLLAHTLVFASTVTVLSMVIWQISVRRKLSISFWPLLVSLGIWVHLLLDSMWDDPEILLWPAYGLGFPPGRFSWAHLTESPVAIGGEIAGAVIIASIIALIHIGRFAPAEKETIVVKYTRKVITYLKTPLYKNAIFLMANTVAASGLGFFFWMVVARYYAPFEAGIAVVTLQSITFLAMLSKLGFDVSLVRFLPSSGKDSKDLINSCFTISGGIAILVSIVFLLGLDVWASKLVFIRQNWIFLLSFILFSVVFALIPLMNQVFVARRRAELVFAGSVISGLRIVFPILFAVGFGLGAFGIFASWSVAMLITLLIGIFVFIPRVNPGYRPVPTVKGSVVGETMKFSGGNYVAQIFGSMPSFLLPLVILHAFASQGLEVAGEKVAYYYFALMISGLIFAIIAAVCMSLFAEGSHFERELKSNVRKALGFIFVLLVPAIIVVLLLGNYLLLLFGEEYSTEGLALLQLFALSSVFMAFNNVFLATRRVLKRLKPIIAIPVFNAFATVGLAYFLMSFMGLVGVAVGWIISQGLVSLGIGIFLSLRFLREREAPA